MPLGSSGWLSEHSSASRTVFWRSDKAAGITYGVANCNFKTKKKAVEDKKMVVPVPQARVKKAKGS
jgi:hypothetical protein